MTDPAVLLPGTLDPLILKAVSLGPRHGYVVLLPDMFHRAGPYEPLDPKAVFGKVRAPVVVLLRGHSYRSTIFAMGGVTGIPLRRSNREAAGLEGGESVSVLLELDERLKDAVDRGMPTVRVLGNLCLGRGTPGWPSDREILRLEAQVTSAVERLPSIVVCAYDVTTLPGPMLLKGGLECHPLTFRRDCLRHNEHHVSPERFLEELAAGSG